MQESKGFRGGGWDPIASRNSARGLALGPMFPHWVPYVPNVKPRQTSSTNPYVSVVLVLVLVLVVVVVVLLLVVV